MFIIISIIYSYMGKYEIDSKGEIIIGKFVSYESYPKSSNSFFIFYTNGVKRRESSGTAPFGFRYNIGKFYKIKYLDKYPNAIHPLYDQEVTDTIELLKAGFSMDEILNKKENNLFPPAGPSINK